MKKLLLIAGIFFALTLTHTSAQVTQLLRPFPDVLETHEAYEAILYLHANHIVQGHPDGQFYPESLINRAEFTKILVTAIADPAVIETCLQDMPQPFSDVPNDEWFARYICTAKKFKMAFGNPDGTYRPANPINFAEASTLMTRNLGISTETPKPEARWYKPFIEALEAKHAIPLSITRFEHPITRAEMAEMMYRIKAKIPPKPSLTYAQLETLSAKAPASSGSGTLASDSGSSLQSSVASSRSSGAAVSSAAISSAPSSAGVFAPFSSFASSAPASSRSSSLPGAGF